MSKHERYTVVAFRLDGGMSDDEFYDREDAERRFDLFEEKIGETMDSVQLYGWLAGTGEPQLVKDVWHEEPQARRKASGR